MRIPDPKANTTTEAYLAYKAGYLEESELKPKLYEPYLHFDAWLAYWAGLTNTYPLDKNGDPEMLTDEEALVAYLSGVTDTYPEEIKDPYDVRIVGYLKHLASIRWSEPDYPVNNEEFYLSTMEPTHTSNSVPSSDIELDTAEGKIIDVEAYGDTTQTTYSGKNLFDYPSRVATQGGGLTWSLGDDGYFTISGTLTTSYTNIVSAYDITDMLVDGQTYTVSTSGTGNQYAYTMLATTNIGTGTAQYHGTSTSPYTFTVDKSTYTYRLNAQTATTATWGSTSRTLKVGFQLEKSATATDFQKYVGGTASPNPDYPQEIQTVTGENLVKVVGKNLLPTRNVQRTINGITFTPNSDGSVTVDGTATANATYFLNANQSWGVYTIPLKGGETYTINGRNSDGILIQAGVRPIGGGGSATMYPVGTFTPPSDSEAYAYIRISSGTTVNNQTFYVQLEHGSQSTQFETCNEQDFEISLTGKNLFNKATSTDGYRIDSNGDPYANAAYFISDYIAVQPSTTYAYSRGAAGSGLATIAYYKSDKTFISRTMPTIGSSDTSGTVTTPNDAYYARFCDVNEVLDSAQLELGSTATEYEAYSPIELAKIGTYQDKIYKEGEKWYVEKQVGKIVFDSTNLWGWQIYQIGQIGYQFFKSVSDVNHQASVITTMSDHFIGSCIDNRGTIGNSVYTYNGGIAFNPLGFDDLDAWKAWVSANPVTAYYTLATPTTTEITNQSLIDQLEALAGADTYNVKTYIKVTATEHNLPALLKVEAYKY